MCSNIAKKSHYVSVNAKTVALCLDSPYSVYCDKFVDRVERDKISEFDKMLFEKGIDHEDNVVREKYPNSVSVSFKSPELGFRSTIESMISGVDALHSIPMNLQNLSLQHLQM